MSDARLRVAVVGAGYVGQLAHVAPLCAFERCRVVALADLRPELAREVAARYGIPRVYDSHAALLADGGVDAVVVVTTRPATGPIALDALRAGKHVLSEKPMAHSVAQGERLVAAARAGGLTYAVGFMKRHDPGVLAARRLLRDYRASEKLGKLEFVRAYSLHGNVGLEVERTVMSAEPRPDGLEFWPTAPDFLSGERASDFATFLNVHVHAVNLLRYLFGGPLIVERAPLQRGALRSLEFAVAEVPGVLEMRDASESVWTEGVEAFFERGSVRLTLPAPFARGGVAAVAIEDRAGTQKVEATESGWSFDRQARAFVDDCLQARAPLASGEDSLADLEFAEAMWRVR